MSAKQVGVISQKIIQILGLSCPPDIPIYIGVTNETHIKNHHPHDYIIYFNDISTIISQPDYVCLNPKDSSIEYVKEYQINCEYVKIAVRISRNGNYFVHSLYRLNNRRVSNSIPKGTLKKYEIFSF